MNGWGFLMWLGSVAAVFSLPVVLFAGLMWLVGRLGGRTLAIILGFDGLLWVGAYFFWFSRISTA